MKKIVGYTIAAALLMPTNVAFANEQIASKSNTEVAAASMTNLATNKAELESLIDTNLNSYETSFVLHFTGTSAALKAEIEAYIDNYKTKNLYVGWMIDSRDIKVIESGSKATITFKMKYLTTKAQETAFEASLQTIAKSIFTNGMSGFDKVKAVNDYIVANTAFTNETSTSPYAPYTITSQRKGVSQAYALLAYRLLKLKVVESLDTAGRPVSIVVSDSSFPVQMVNGKVENGVPHVWNLVQLGASDWYHLDTSWNDSYPDIASEVKYNYFLMSDAKMTSLNTHKYTGTEPATNTQYDGFADAQSPIKVENSYFYSNKSDDYTLYKIGRASQFSPIRMKALAYDAVNKVLYFANYSSKGDLYKVNFDGGTFDPAEMTLVQTGQIKSLSVDEKSKMLNYTFVNGGSGRLPLKTRSEFDTAAMTPVFYAINSLGNPTHVTTVHVDSYVRALVNYNKLTSAQRSLVTNGGNLPLLEAKLTADQREAAKAIQAIYEMDELHVSFASKAKSARAIYDALSVEQKKLVTNLSTLLAAEAKVKSNLAMTLSIDEAIEALKPKVRGFYNEVSQIRARYEALTEAQKQLIVKYDALLVAETTAKEDLQKANSFDYRLLFLTQTDENYETKVAALRDEYDNTLSLNQKSLIKLLSKLSDAEKNVADNAKTIEKWKEKVKTLDALQVTLTGYGKAIYSLRAEYDKFTTLQKSLAGIDLLTELEEHEAYIAVAEGIAAPVVALIAALDVNMSNIQKKIDEAKTAYNALDALSQECVSNYDRIADIEKWIVYKKDIDKVENLIRKIVKGSSSYKANTYEARFAYNTLTEYAQSKVSNYAILLAAEKDIAAEQKPDEEVEGEVTEKDGVFTIIGGHKNGISTFEIPADVVRKSFGESGNATIKLSLKNNIQVTIPPNAINERSAQHASARVTVEVRKNNDLTIELQLITPGKEIELIELNDYVTIELPLDNVYDGYDDFVVLQETDTEFVAIPFRQTNSNTLVIKARTFGRYIFDSKTSAFRDIGTSSYAEDILFLANRRIVKGTTETTYSPTKSVTRAQFAGMLARALNLKPTEETSFEDIKGQWYESDVQALKEFGVINGVSDYRFNPSGKLTRQQAAVMVYRMIEKTGYDLNDIDISSVSFKDDHLFSTEVNEAVKTLYILDVLSGKPSGHFDPRGNINRGQMAKILKNSLELIEYY